MEKIEVFLKPIYMEPTNETLGNVKLRRFQTKVADIQDGAILLSAPTGSGKTVTLLTDKERKMAVGLYPNNELVLNQISGLHSFIVERLGMRTVLSHLYDYAVKGEEVFSQQGYLPLNVYEASSPIKMFNEKVNGICILGLSGKIIRAFLGVGSEGHTPHGNNAEGVKGQLNSKLSIVRSAVEKCVKYWEKGYYVIVTATPDTYFLLAMYGYGDPGAIGRATSAILNLPPNADMKYIEEVFRRSYIIREKLTKVVSAFLPIKNATLFVDEYHLYDLYEQSSFKVLLFLLNKVHEWRGRLIFSSATPKAEFVREIASEADFSNVKSINALEEVKDSGDEESIVRGGVKLIFCGVETSAQNKLGKVYRAIEMAKDLIKEEEFKHFINSYRNGYGRGLVVLEKVSHADMFAEKVFKEYGAMPVCLFSTAMPSFPSSPPETAVEGGPLFIVGSGAKIGQGVEYRKVSFGIIARATSLDYLQSLGRIGRRYLGESVVLTPIDESYLEKLEKEVKGSEMEYRDLVEWAESTKVLLQKRDFEPQSYRALIAAREELLKALGLSLFYRHTSTWSEDVRNAPQRIRGINLRILSPPDEMCQLMMFRSTGPEVRFYRMGCEDAGKCDLGTLLRNYEVSAKGGRITVINRGRSELFVKCHRGQRLLKDIGEDRTLTLALWSFLRDVFDCKCVDSEGNELSINELPNDQMLMVVDFLNEEVAEYIASTGRGLRVILGEGTKKTMALVFV